jgi:hypothetical protein
MAHVGARVLDFESLDAGYGGLIDALKDEKLCDLVDSDFDLAVESAPMVPASNEHTPAAEIPTSERAYRDRDGPLLEPFYTPAAAPAAFQEEAQISPAASIYAHANTSIDIVDMDVAAMNKCLEEVQQVAMQEIMVWSASFCLLPLLISLSPIAEKVLHPKEALASKESSR